MTAYPFPMLYSAARREDGTPVPVTERFLVGLGGVGNWEPLTRPVSWAAVFPGDTVIVEDPDFDHPNEFKVWGWSGDRIRLWDTVTHYVIEHPMMLDGVILICKDPCEQRQMNPAWMFPRFLETA